MNIIFFMFGVLLRARRRPCERLLVPGVPTDHLSARYEHEGSNGPPDCMAGAIQPGRGPTRWCGERVTILRQSILVQGVGVGSRPQSVRCFPSRCRSCGKSLRDYLGLATLLGNSRASRWASTTGRDLWSGMGVRQPRGLGEEA